MADAAKRLGKRFTDFQQQCLCDVTQHLTMWKLFAGAGKTTMLKALMLMAVAHSPNVLVWVVGPTNRVAADLFSAVEEIMNPETCCTFMWEPAARVWRMRVPPGSRG